jgi:ABC-2 type transport system permease protein
MSAAVETTAPSAPIGLRSELRKISAFLRRDLLVAWSYKGRFISDWLGIGLQVILFYLVGRMVDPSHLPSFGGHRSTYLEFVSVGIALGAFVQLGLGRVAYAVRQEQLIGTLEALLLTPTAPATIQIGSVVYDLLYIPIRTAAFLGITAAAFGLHFHAGGIAPALVLLLSFIPFVWGLGVFSAATTLTFKRGGSGTAFVMTILTIGSGAYFPLSLLPHWLATVAAYNPMATAVTGIRAAIIGTAGWNVFGLAQILLLPVSLAVLTFGVGAFKVAIRREQARGTLAMY